MDEKETGLIRRGADNGFGELGRLTHDIDSIRHNLADLIDELDRRRREAMNLRLQVQRHPVPFAVGVGLFLGLVAGGIALGIAQHRRHAGLGFRARRLGRNLGRLLQSQRRLMKREERDHSAGRKAGRAGLKLLAAGGKLAAALVARRARSRRRDR